MSPTPRLGRLAPIVLFACLAAVPARAQSVAVVVNGQPILSSEIQARAALTKLSGGKSAKSPQDELIEEKLKLAEVKRYGMGADDSQVEAAFASIAARTKLSTDQFIKAIGQRGVSAQTLKDRIRAEIGWATLIRRKYASQLASSSDVTAALAGRNAQGQGNKATQYTLRQVIFVLPKGASDAQTSQRKTEAIGARGRFPGCEQALPFASALRDVAVKEPVVRSSAQLGKDMAELLAKTKVGGLTEPQRGEQGWEMIAICERKDIADDGALRAQVLEEVGSKGAEEKSNQYLALLRSRAVIEIRR